MAEISGWTIHAAGERQVSASTHVGYLVGVPGINRDMDAAFEGLLGTGALCLFLPLVLWVACKRWRVGLALAVLWCIGLARCQWLMAETYTLRSEYQEALVALERFSAEIEADAVARGRWPDLRRWMAAHPAADASAASFVYRAQRVAAVRAEPWAALSLRAFWQDGPKRPFLVGFPRMPMDARLFGADGLYGTADDDPRLAKALDPRRHRHQRTQWPHGRAPRDPKVKLPAWPKLPEG